MINTRGNMKILIAALLLPLVSGLLGPQSFLEQLKSYSLTDGHNIPTSRNPSRDNYDFVIVGAGSGGSTVANRLSENPEWNVLLIEAGKPEGILNQIPMITSIFATTDYNWGYKVEPQEFACHGMDNNQCTWPRGKSLGGTSTLNYMIHTRGSKLDYDNWAALGNYGWSYDEVLPYFRKSERFNVSGVKDLSYHNTEGYLCVEDAPYRTELARTFLEAGVQTGDRIQNDYNGEEQLGYSYLQLNMDRGTRCSASKAYLSIRRPNLEIVPLARVTKILIGDDLRAYGVDYRINGLNRQVRATKEVILSAGTIDSAKLLMLSGIGPKEHLEELDIKVVKDSPVGYNLYEHIGFLGPTFVVNKSVTILLKDLLSPDAMIQYVTGRTGPLSLAGGAEALAFIRTIHATDSRPDLEILFASGSLNADKGLGERISHGVSDAVYNTVFKPLENANAFMVWAINQNPRSVGRIKLRTNDPLDPPVLLPNFFTDPMDVEVILEGVKEAIKLSKTEAFRAYGTRLHDIKLPGCQAHDFGTDDYWRCAIRQLPSMMNHEIGTAKMGPDNDPGAVVDNQLRVRGIRGLRVVDASIMPKITVGHTNAVVYMIGEKASDMIKKFWEQ